MYINLYIQAKKDEIITLSHKADLKGAFYDGNADIGKLRILFTSPKIQASNWVTANSIEQQHLTQ